MGSRGEDKVGKIIAFPVRSARPGCVFCKWIGVHFPVLYRITVSITLDDLKRLGLQNEPEYVPNTWKIFDLDPNNTYVGTSIIEAVSHIEKEESDESFVIRYHKNIEEAHGHLRGYQDVFMSDWNKTTCGLYKTVDGIFTFFSIPTSQNWSGPLVFYLADVPNEIAEGDDAWAYVVGPDGEALKPEDFGFSS